MRMLLLVVLTASLTCWGPAAQAEEDLPKAAQEVLKQYEEETTAIEKRVEPAIRKKLDKAQVELKKIQDSYCKEAKLDEAVAVRDLIRNLQASPNLAPSTGLPAAAQEVLKQYQGDVAEIYARAQADAKKGKEKALSELQKVQDSYCRDARLDEAVAVRDLIRNLLDSGKTALADPGNLIRAETDIGKVFYYRVTGATTGGAIYGSDIYVNGSTLSMVAVHAGVLKEGEYGMVKATILPGQPAYQASTRYGITSNAYAGATVSFKVERAHGFFSPTAYGKVLADPGTLASYRGQNGKAYLFEITGRVDGSIAGTDLYTDDSALATAAVHAGVLTAGQTGIVRVTILQGEPTYAGTTRNGVTSNAAINFPGSFRVEAASIPANPPSDHKNPRD